ncbi:MAG: NAD-dependent epimerase/dehydratase family protein [Elusimicrobiota bacterium]
MEGKALVTGGAGFMGSHVTDEIIAMGMEVVVLDDLSGGFKENVNPKAQFVEGNINDENLVKSLFEKNNFKYVYHLAAYAAEGLSHFIKKFNYVNNLIGSINLINASVNHEIECFIFTSSIAVYGKNQLPMGEELIPLPEDSYGIAKLAVEQELKVSHEMFGLNYIIFRPHNVYGEKQNIGDKYRNVIGIFMNQILENSPLTIFGDGEQTRAFTYIKDIAPVIAKSRLIKEAYNQIFNIGADIPYTVNYLAQEVCKTMGTKPNIRHLPERKEVKHAYSDHSKVKTVFGYKTRYSLQDGLKNMAKWVKQVGSKKSKKFDNIEIIKNLPAFWLE